MIYLFIKTTTITIFLLYVILIRQVASSKVIIIKVINKNIIMKKIYKCMYC